MAVPSHGRMADDVLHGFEAASPEERIRRVLNSSWPHDQRFLSLFWEKQCTLRDVKVVSPTNTVVTYAFKVDRYYCNGSDNLHGGAQATIFDMCTSLALQAVGKRDFWLNAGVSRTLAVTYLRPAPEGEALLCECEIVGMGKSLALLRGVLKRERDGAVISTCEHDKAAVPSKPGWKM